MKSLPLLCTCILFLLLQKYGYADALWDCYHYTAKDRALMIARGGPSNQAMERKVCEEIRGHVFTEGVDSLAPGCGECWCCQKQEILWTCHRWTASDLVWIKALGGNKEAERLVCDAKEGYVFTAGENTLAPGCGSCWCCRKA